MRYFSKRFGANIADGCFLCAGAVGVGRCTVGTDVDRPRNTKRTGRPRGAIGKRKRAVKPTVRRNGGDG